MLRIYTLGGLHTTVNNRPIAFTARRAEVLLCYLALTQRTHEREALANLLWDGRSQKQTMANLRSLLAQMPSDVKPFIMTTRKTIAVVQSDATTDGVWVDAITFERSFSYTPSDPTALALFRDDFLNGVFLSGSRGLEEWIAVTRERLRQVALTAHHAAATRALYARDYQVGIMHAQQLVTLDPLRETAQRLLMRLLVRAGEINTALQQYHRLAELLADELSVSPSAETKRLFQRIQSLRQHPPLRLPVQFNPFVGRASELAQIAQRLDDPSCRLLTLHGTGGIGKTRLALAAAELLASDFMHGVVFVGLTSAENGSHAQLLIANQLALPISADKPVIEYILQYLHEKELLLLLDNAERLVEDLQPLLDRLLRQLPLLHVLVTSRTRLQLAAEWVLPLEGLAYQGDTREAVDFFTLCAQRHQPNFVLTTSNINDVQQICRLLQGLPLGIELAAAAVRALSAEKIAQTLAISLNSLATEQYGTPTRQRSLRAAFNYSWQLLTTAEQDLLMRLAVFRAGFDQAAVDSVAQTGERLSALVDKSLVQPLGNGHYGLHPAIEQFSAEKLASAQQTTATRSAHSRYYGMLLATLDDQLKDDRQVAALRTTESAEANLEHGWRFAVEQADWPTIAAYLFPLHNHYEAKSRYAQAADIFAVAFAKLSKLPEPDQLVLGSLLGNIGFHYERIGRLDEADTAFDQAVVYLAETAAQEQLLTIFAHRGAIQYDRGNMAAAKAIYYEGSETARRIEDGRALAHCLSFLGYIETAFGNVVSAESYFQESISAWRDHGTPRGLVIALNGLAELYEQQGQFDDASTIYAENLQICRDVGDAMGEARTLQNLGGIALESDDFSSARHHLEAALTVNETRIKNDWLDCFLSTRLAFIALTEHALDEAGQLYQHALTYTQATDDKRGSATALNGLGRVALARHDLATAASHLRAGLALTLTTEWLPMTLDMLVYLAEIEAVAGDKALAQQTLQLVSTHSASSAQTKAVAAVRAEKYGAAQLPSLPTLDLILTRLTS